MDNQRLPLRWVAMEFMSRRMLEDMRATADVMPLMVLQIAAKMRGLGHDPYAPESFWYTREDIVKGTVAVVCEVEA